MDLGFAGFQNTGGAGFDSLEEIENLAGSPFADELTGDEHANTLTGWEGADSLRGQGGEDHVAARDGTRDLVACGSGADSVDADEQSVDSIFGDCETTAFAPFVPPAGEGTAAGGAMGTGTGGRYGTRQGQLRRLQVHDQRGSPGPFPLQLSRRSEPDRESRLRERQKGPAQPHQRGCQADRSPADRSRSGRTAKVTLRVKLSARNLSVLKLNRRIRTRVTVTLANSAGLTSRASRQITLRAPKR